MIEVSFCGRRALVPRASPVANLQAIFGPSDTPTLISKQKNKRALVTSEGTDGCFTLEEGGHYIVARSRDLASDPVAIAATTPAISAVAPNATPLLNAKPVPKQPERAEEKKHKVNEVKPAVPSKSPAPVQAPITETDSRHHHHHHRSDDGEPEAKKSRKDAQPNKVTSVSAVSIAKPSPSPAAPFDPKANAAVSYYLSETPDVFLPPSNDKKEKRDKKDKHDKKEKKDKKDKSEHHHHHHSSRRSNSPSRAVPSMAPPSPVKPAALINPVAKRAPPPASPALGFQNPPIYSKLDSDSD